MRESKGTIWGGYDVNKTQVFPLEREQTLTQWDPFGVPEGSPNFYTPRVEVKPSHKA